MDRRATNPRPVANATMPAPTAVELFAGAGGLLLGASKAGIKHVAASEWDKWACSTMRENASAGHPLIQGLNILEGDIRDINWKHELNGAEIDIVSGGPPCQPFSMGGLARAADDPRDMFPSATSVVEELRPKAFIIENVKGLTRSSFSDYFEFIKLRLQHPEIRAKEGELWQSHFRRLQREHTSASSDLRYNLVTSVVNSADYGVPQHRHRVFLVGFREDINAEWSFPEPTHSGNALAMEQSDGLYWERFEVSPSERIPIPRKGKVDGKLPWVTVREALWDLPEPELDGTDGWHDHKLQLGAKIYPGHTGSPIDEPSKTLKAGNHGVPGGENMIRFPDGSVRYFSIREAARIQTFPDDYTLHGSWSEAMRQLGNAVPVSLANIVASSVKNHLSSTSGQLSLKIVS